VLADVCGFLFFSFFFFFFFFCFSSVLSSDLAIFLDRSMFLLLALMLCCWAQAESVYSPTYHFEYEGEKFWSCRDLSRATNCKSSCGGSVHLTGTSEASCFDCVESSARRCRSKSYAGKMPPALKVLSGPAFASAGKRTSPNFIPGDYAFKYNGKEYHSCAHLSEHTNCRDECIGSVHFSATASSGQESCEECRFRNEAKCLKKAHNGEMPAQIRVLAGPGFHDAAKPRSDKWSHQYSFQHNGKHYYSCRHLSRHTNCHSQCLSTSMVHHEGRGCEGCIEESAVRCMNKSRTNQMPESVKILSGPSY
jgi:hypothetical protein